MSIKTDAAYGTFYIDVDGGSGSHATIVLHIGGGGECPSIVQTVGSYSNYGNKISKARITKYYNHDRILQLYADKAFFFMQIKFVGSNWEYSDQGFVNTTAPTYEKNLLYGASL